MFDKLVDFRSYTQSKGRARDKDSKYIIMVGSDELKFPEKYCNFKTLEAVMKKVIQFQVILFSKTSFFKITTF